MDYPNVEPIFAFMEVTKRHGDQIRVGGDIKRRLEYYVFVHGGTIAEVATKLLDKSLPKLPKSVKKKK